ncbi:reverse transcriptase domain-containing protein [Tanacetum coccineum]
MSMRLAKRSFQYLVGIAENMLVEVGKFTFPVDFVILEMEEDSKVPLILGRPFLHTTDAVIRVKQKQLNLKLELKHSYSNYDTCFSIDVIDEILEEDFDALLDEVIINENDELVPTRTVTGWRVCIDYRKLNEVTTKDHFPLPFMDQMLERHVGNKYFCFLDGFFGYFQIPIDPNDQEKTTFACPFGTYAYRRMPFGLCNAPATFMDDFSIFRNSFDTCLNNLDKMLQRCKDSHLVLNWEKCHFMVKEGIILGHKVSSTGLEVDKAKINVISKLLPLPTSKVLEANDSKVDDNFPGETIMEINTKDEPWFEDFANYLVGDIIPKGMTYQQKNKFFSDLKHYFWEEPYLFKWSIENTNIALKRILEKTVKDNPTIWSRKLNDALWAFHTAYRTPTNTTPYKHIYGKNCHLPVEIEHRAYWALKNCNPDLIAASEKRMFQLHELDELRHQAYENSRLYKGKNQSMA